jgi:hypothetical protein
MGKPPRVDYAGYAAKGTGTAATGAQSRAHTRAGDPPVPVQYRYWRLLRSSRPAARELRLGSGRCVCGLGRAPGGSAAPPADPSPRGTMDFFFSQAPRPLGLCSWWKDRLGTGVGPHALLARPRRIVGEMIFFLRFGAPRYGTRTYGPGARGYLGKYAANRLQKGRTQAAHRLQTCCQ